MAVAQLDGSAIADWDDFHSACAKEFGFPSFYGRNGNAWIDCLSYVDQDDGMCRFSLAPGETLRIEVMHSDVLLERAAEILEALADWVNCVNDRLGELGRESRLQLVLK